MKRAIRPTTFLCLALVLLLASSWITPGGAFSEGDNRRSLWNSGTDLNAPERITIEVPLKGENVETFKIFVTYAYGGPGWVAFMNRGGPVILPLEDTGGDIETVSFTVDAAFVNRDGIQNVTVRGNGAEQGLHLYSIKVVAINESD
ncbi:MAG: hypothetical protein ACKVQW_06045 [Pyrinomonadaceae bacterium]